MSRTAGGSTANYTWDVAAGLPVVLQDGTNTYVYGLDLIASVAGTTPTYYLYDGLGSTRGLTNGQGQQTVTYSYDAFGSVRTHTGASTQWSYTGEQNDPSGLEYLRARYYDPAIGRFLSRDPLASIQQYAYVGNSPVNFTDPLGLDCGLTRPWECKGVPVPTWPVPVEWPDIPLPRFDPGNPIEHAKEWWDWITRSKKEPEPVYQPYPKEDMVQPWTPGPQWPGQILPPGSQPPTGGPGKWIRRLVLAAMGAAALEQSGALDMCRPPKA